MLNVIDNGARISTPWYAVFPPRSTEKLTQTPASGALSKHDQVRESRSPHPSAGQKAYQQVEHNSEERHKVVLVKEIMSASVVYVPGETNIFAAWSEFKKHGIRHMPVVDERNRLKGIISDRDILNAWANMALTNKSAIEAKQVSEIMTARVLTGGLDTSIREIADAMTVRRIGAVPLVDEDQHVVGIVTRSDILRTIAHQAPLDLWS